MSHNVCKCAMWRVWSFWSHRFDDGGRWSSQCYNKNNQWRKWRCYAINVFLLFSLFDCVDHWRSDTVLIIVYIYICSSSNVNSFNSTRSFCLSQKRQQHTPSNQKSCKCFKKAGNQCRPSRSTIHSLMWPSSFVRSFVRSRVCRWSCVRRRRRLRPPSHGTHPNACIYDGYNN